MGRVQMPVNLGAVIELFVSQQVKAVAPDLVCFSNQVLGLVWQLPAQKLAAALGLISAEEEFRCFRSGRRHGFGARVQSAPVRCQINSLSSRLPQASVQFIPAQVSEPRPGFAKIQWTDPYSYPV